MSVGPLAYIAVSDGEWLARFILTERYVAKGDVGVTAQALLPFKWVELSVSRHRDVSEEELWQFGRDVASQRSDTEAREVPLVGRADFLARVARQQSLDVKPDEPPRNHAAVFDWPAAKSAQMSRAQQIAARTFFVRHPVQAA